jgi:hypothetical protein
MTMILRLRMNAVAGAVLSAGLLIAAPTAARCQRLTPPLREREPTASRLDQRAPQRAEVILFTSGETRRTYWLEGGIVGGVLLGVVGYSMSSACPANSGSCPSRVVGFGIGASVGFVIGAFVGDTMEKEP